MKTLKTIAIMLAVIAAASCNSSKLSSFRPGEIWPDNNGIHINAHGGGILMEGDTYYWYGEHKIEGTAGNVAHVGVHVYSSKDLYNWKDEGIALAVTHDEDSDIREGMVIERPKVIHNARTGKYVMWFHLERDPQYLDGRTGIAVADSPVGPFTYIRCTRATPKSWPDNVQDFHKGPVAEGLQDVTNLSEGQHPDEVNTLGRDFEIGQHSRDMTLFVDDDGKAYHICSSESNSTLHINELTDDYLDFTGRYIRIFSGCKLEAPAIFKHEGRYYMMMSGCTGWAPNPGHSASAPSIWGPWEEMGNPCVGPGKETTFDSQSTYFITLPDGRVIYMGDRWCPENAIDGRYIWLPVEFNEDGTYSIRWRDEWSLDGKAGSKPLCDAHEYSNPCGGDFPIMAWFTLHGQHLAARHIPLLEEAGFNLAFSFLSDMAEVDSVLAAAEGSKVGIIASCKELARRPEEAVRHLMGSPAVAGYFLRDEPGADDFADLHEWAERIRTVDDSRMLYLNLHPTYAPDGYLNVDTYEEYVRRFCDEVPLGWMSFDHYPVLDSGIRPDFYHNLEVVSSNARRKRIPFWAFVLSTAHGQYPIATYESMSLQAYTDLAYGAQGIEYFTFQPGQLRSLSFHHAPIEADGSKTPTFDLVKRLNSEIQALTPVFLGAEIDDVSHLGELPKGTHALAGLPQEVKALSGEDVLVSQFHNGERRYLMVVSRSLDASQEVSIDFQSSGVSRILPGEASQAQASGVHTETLTPGGMLLYCLD